MSQAVITPVLGVLPTTEAELVNLSGTATEYAVDMRLTNTTSSSITVRVALANVASPTYASGDGAYALYDYVLAGNASLDVLRGEPLTTGTRIRGRAGAAGVQFKITGTQRSTL